MSEKIQELPCAFSVFQSCENIMQLRYIRCMINEGEKAYYDFEICNLCLQSVKIGLLAQILETLKENKKN